MDESSGEFIPTRYPDEHFEVTEDYPGLIVHDGRVSGAITSGHSRLPFFALLPNLVESGYPGAQESFEELHISEECLSQFLEDLFEQRRNFARLLCVLADMKRWERDAFQLMPKRDGDVISRPHWYYDADQVRRVREALSACTRELEVLQKEDRDKNKFRINLSENGSAILTMVHDNNL